MTGTYKLYGALASPYSLKMRAILRYRRIPHVWIDGAATYEHAVPQVKAPVIPVLEDPEGRFANDSTVLIDDLDARVEARRVTPEDAGDAFLSRLIEDFADEWLTKAMFQYRWRRAADQEQMQRWLAFDFMHGGGRERIEAFGADFAGRQVSRLSVVGSRPENYDLIEETAREVLAALDADVVDGFFLFGTRPSRAEFALYGQISQFAVDPTPQAMMRSEFPYAYRWVEHMHDLSGVEGEWAPAAPPRTATRAILSLVGEIYLPFLMANLAALEAGAEEVVVDLRGRAFRQAPFRYQGKCLAALRRAFAETPAEGRARITPILSETGCLAALETGR